MSIGKNERALLVVSNMVIYGRSDLKWLYQFIEFSGAALADMILRPRYQTYHKLIGAAATKSAFIEAIASLGADDSVKAVDVILMLHGFDGVLCFADSESHSVILADEISALNLKSKLRMLYSTTCYGKSHAIDFVAAGFQTACGSIATNANAATEYPTVLTMWAAGSKLKNAIAAGDLSLTRQPQDLSAKAMGFADANSTKEIIGNGNITIKT
jgi:hypothetical protein